jgi:hypothetical protein
MRKARALGQGEKREKKKEQEGGGGAGLIYDTRMVCARLQVGSGPLQNHCKMGFDRLTGWDSAGLDVEVVNHLLQATVRHG